MPNMSENGGQMKLRFASFRQKRTDFLNGKHEGRIVINIF
ncbi:hypothetical protein LEP1GSC073_3164 [Leptospira noguchii str. Cascata]|uniref:Uncharacterized protein n=1 Tax=Leptospira noguchii str. 2001034031 TaxID=1193053 RepID=M6Y1U0_9LEPT|nr:hypothetical protein LEP1GSC072_2160 [Leptospira noguchii str. Bonito]EMO87655.1 hypothetical protein LEP1GSC024_3410 [Leptospira noguchii str. 2001034031]EMS86430.1 hypothetical protein LEP1GSC073_3164 [Leptospira noguchii str. Cascata]